jgi:hypothetical protein
MNQPKPALTTEQVLTTLDPWLSEQPTDLSKQTANVAFGDGSTEGISVGAFAANIAQAAILDTSNPKPQDLVAELLCEGDQSAASTLIIDASEDKETLLAFRDRLEAAINRQLDRVFRQTLVADITASGEPHNDAYLCLNRSAAIALRDLLTKMINQEMEEVRGSLPCLDSDGEGFSIQLKIKPSPWDL